MKSLMVRKVDQKNHNEVNAGAVVATALWQKHLGDANNLTVNI